jgi:hypothetical protein
VKSLEVYVLWVQKATSLSGGKSFKPRSLSEKSGFW